MTNSTGSSLSEADILASDTSFLCMKTNDSDEEGLCDQYMNVNTSVSVEEPEDNIIVQTDSAGTDLSFAIGNQIPMLPPMINVNNISTPEDLGESLPDLNVQNFRLYLQTQCYKGCKWTSSLSFEGSQDRETYQEMDVLQYIGDPIFKHKEGGECYRVYLNPSKYPVTEELQTIASLPENTTLKVCTQKRFKSKAYMKLSKDLRDASGSCGFNLVQNGNQKSSLKKSGLSIRNRYSCQKYMIHKGGIRDIVGNKDFRKYTFRND